MNKDEIFLTIFLYCLVVLISSSRPFWGQIGSFGWVRTLVVELQKPVFPEGAPVRTAPIVVMKPVHRAWISQKIIHKPRKALALPLDGITTVKKNSTQGENTKG
jgi:hypothetical protein